ncbi:MAG: preprotein translocase subunit SecE [Eubacteriales bacterium]|nr:preprotein translocase subunit SecE [Eubacteriales bacterium]
MNNKDNNDNNVSVKSVDNTESSESKKVAPKKKTKISLKAKILKALREYKSELKKIVWFNREQTFKSSVIVIISVIIVSAFISSLDYIFSTALLWLGKLV